MRIVLEKPCPTKHRDGESRYEDCWNTRVGGTCKGMTRIELDYEEMVKRASESIQKETSLTDWFARHVARAVLEAALDE